MDPNTRINCPDLIRGAFAPWTGTLAELIRSTSVERLAVAANDLGLTGDWTDADLMDRMTVEGIRSIADDPNAVVIGDDSR